MNGKLKDKDRNIIKERFSVSLINVRKYFKYLKIKYVTLLSFSKQHIFVGYFKIRNINLYYV